jgi:hypothetical protein
MASWLKRLLGGNEPPQVLHFKSGDAALEYACQFMNCDLQPGVILPAVVQQTWPQKDEMTDFGLFLAGRPNPVPVKTTAPTSLGLKPGDLVGFRVMAIRPPPAGIFGVTEALLQPSYDMKRGCWLIDRVLFNG